MDSTFSVQGNTSKITMPQSTFKHVTLLAKFVFAVMLLNEHEGKMPKRVLAVSLLPVVF